MKQMVIDYPDDLAEALHVTQNELTAQVRLMAALKMFELGKISSGKAAELAGLSRVEFLEACGRCKISPFNYGPGEIEAELRSDLETIRGNSPDA